MIEERIKQALAVNKMSVNKLSQLLGMNQATLNNQIRGASPLTAETIEKIMPYITNISEAWILRGEGTMEKGVINQLIGRLGSCGDGDVFQQVNSEDTAELKRQIEELKKEKERLLNIIETLLKK